MLNWMMPILRRLPVRHRLALVIATILTPAALTTLVLLRAVDEADRALGSSISQTVNDLMPVARLEANLQQARYDLERLALAGVNDSHSRLSKRIEDDFDVMLAQHDLPPILAGELTTAFSKWREVAPVLDNALAAQAPSAMSGRALTAGDQGLAQTIATLEQLRTQLLEAVKSKYAREKRAEYLYNRTLLVLWTAGFLAATLAVYLLSASILRPLREIDRAASLLRRGDFAVRLPVEGKDEFTFVSSTINAMAETIGETHERLYDTTLRDPLTGVLNRRGLDKALALHFADQRSLSIVMVDVDRFKEINDSFGHPAGDEILVGLAKCMVAATRGGDSIGRYGGDEFMILLPGAELGTAEEVAKRLHTNLGQWNLGRPFSVQISVGIAQRDASLSSPKLLIEAADRALYRSKEAGRAIRLSSEK